MRNVNITNTMDRYNWLNGICENRKNWNSLRLNATKWTVQFFSCCSRHHSNHLAETKSLRGISAVANRIMQVRCLRVANRRPFEIGYHDVDNRIWMDQSSAQLCSMYTHTHTHLATWSGFSPQRRCHRGVVFWWLVSRALQWWKQHLPLNAAAWHHKS